MKEGRKENKKSRRTTTGEARACTRSRVYAPALVYVPACKGKREKEREREY